MKMHADLVCKAIFRHIDHQHLMRGSARDIEAPYPELLPKGMFRISFAAHLDFSILMQIKSGDVIHCKPPIGRESQPSLAQVVEKEPPEQKKRNSQS